MTAFADQWPAVLRLMPETVRDAIPTARWRRDALWALALPVEEVAVASLAWVFDLPLWAVDGVPFRVAPNEVRADPAAYVDQYRRTMASDPRDPIHLNLHNGRWTVLDGVHRLLKAAMLGWESIPAMKLSEADFRGIVEPGDAR
jgi:hypothetical protein